MISLNSSAIIHSHTLPSSALTDWPHALNSLDHRGTFVLPILSHVKVDGTVEQSANLLTFVAVLPSAPQHSREALAGTQINSNLQPPPYSTCPSDRLTVCPSDC